MENKEQTILPTKLCAPPLFQKIVKRPRLIKRLVSGLQYKVNLVSAPAGYGKTTLASEFYHTQEIPCAWLTLDRDDNDPVRFWSYFISALQTIQPDIRMPTFQIPPTTGSTPESTMLTALIKEITERTSDLKSACNLILDQYDVIENQSIHNGLIFLIENLPVKMHLLITTRVESFLPLARYRGRGQVNEIRYEDLRFTREEMKSFLNEIMGFDLNDGDIEVLEARTEGWITSLRMAAISMTKQNSVANFIKSFSGSNRHVLDYLTEEVLNQQSPNIRNFLLQTSILSELNPDLCDFITGKNESEDLLKQIETTNIFMVPLDNDRKWYRYHALFADLLHHYLNQVNCDTVSELHKRASIWYEQHNMMVQAISHSLSSGTDVERSASLIEKEAEHLLSLGQIATLQNWIQMLPQQIITSRPLLCTYYALSLLYAGGSLDKIETCLVEAKRGDNDSKLSGTIMAIRAYIAMLQGDQHLSVEMSNQALRLLPRESSLLQLHITGFLGRMHMMNGNVSAAIMSLERVAEISHRTGNVFLQVRGLNRLAELHIMQGKLQEARRYYDQILEVAFDKEGNTLPIAGIAHMGLGELFREWNDLETASRYLEEGIALTKKYSEIRVINGYMSLARVKQAMGQSDAASELIQKAIFLAEQYNIDNIKRIYVGQRQVRFCILQNKLDLAEHLMNDCTLEKLANVNVSDDEEAKIPSYVLVYEYEQITKARLLVANKKPEDAIEILKLLLDRAESQHRTGNLIEMLVLQALARFMQGNTGKALDSLQVALFLARPAGYLRIFIDEGKSIEELLKTAKMMGIEPDYVSELLKALDEYMSKVLDNVYDESSFPETRKLLSVREIEIVRYINEGMSNKAIAEKLCITDGTVKRHKYNIYKKLAVKKRSQSVARAAKELGLI